ncbi:MAG: hypothetical protein AAFX99_34595, partial [Myxococcota bacterium]
MSAVAAHPTQRGFVAVGSDNGVLLSYDNGLSWRTILVIGANLNLTDQDDNSTVGSGIDTSGGDLDARREELIEERTEIRFEELRRETLNELENDGNEEFAQETVDNLENELRQQARLDVLSDQIDAIEQQLQDEAQADAADTGPDLPGVTEVLGQDLNTETTDISTTVGWIAFHPTEPRIIYVATHVGLYRTTNLGRSWDVVFLERQPRTPTRVAVTKNYVLLGTRFGLLRSDNKGDTWEPFVGDLANQPIVAVAARGRYAYVATPNRLFTSINGGQDWLRVPLPASLLNAELTSIAIDFDDPRRFAVGSTIGLYLSSNAGVTLQRSGELGLSNREIRDVRTHPKAPGMLVIATDGGIFSSEDGQSWTPFNMGLTTLDIFRVAIEPSDPYTIYAVSERNGHVFSPRGTDVQARGEALAQLRAQWKAEPTMAQTLAVAAQYALLDRDAWRGWKNRSRWQHVMPRVNGRLTIDTYRNERDQLRVQTPSAAAARTRILDTRDMGTQWQVTASWDLAGLIFNNDETSAASNARSQLSRQRRILRSVAKLYTLRRALMVGRVFRPIQAQDIDKEIAEELRIQE